MKIKSGYILREVQGENVKNSIVIAVGEASKTLNGYITLNDSAVVLWKRLEKGATKNDLVEELINVYGISQEIANKDVDSVINILSSIGAIDE